jgi:hypothetical protein
LSVDRDAAADARLKVLVLGGYGTFGERLCRLLATDPRIALVVAGRSLARAEAACRALPAGAACSAIAMDRDGDIDAVLLAVRPDLLVDATGPWQAYGARPYRLVDACLAHGIDYLDFADDAAFVRGIASLDARAKAAGRSVLSGVSSFPVLTAAVVRHLAHDLARVRSIRAGIAPSPYAGFGLNVIRAIAAYAGKPVALVRDARPGTGYALVETQRYVIAPPGALPLRDTHFSLVEVPDLQLVPLAWPGLEDIWVGVGTVPESLHRLLNGLARAVRWRLLPSLRWLAPVLHKVVNTVRWGEHRGGMFVEVRGVDAAGAATTRSWHLVAEGDAGPRIPCLAIEAIVRRRLEGDVPAPGARAATAALELEDYAPAFARLGIVTGVRREDDAAAPASIFERVLGPAWQALPAPVRALHGPETELRTAGRATVTRGRGLLARVIATVVGFPRPGTDVPVEVRLQRDGVRERWRRTFAGRTFASTLTAGTGRAHRLLRERFGPASFDLALVVDGERLRFVVRGWSVLGLPLPRRWAPTGDSFETAADGRFRFHIEIAHPWTGPIVTYEGWLQPA